MRLLPSFSFTHPAANATRLAIATGALVGLAVLGACADAGKTISGPSGIQSPRNATIDSGGLGFAGVVELCIDATSPAGSYQFKNVEFLSGFENGGTGITAPNAPVGTPYAVTVGGCVTIETRVKPDDSFPAFADTWSGISAKPFTIPANAAYDSTNCVEDLGVKHAEPAPCGVANDSTRAFMNIEHGTQLVYFFRTLPPPPQGCTFTQGYYKNHDDYTASVLANNKNTTYVDGAGKLLIGSYHLTAAQIDDILSTPVGKGYNSGGVVFTAAQLGMIHQLITAELNVTQGSDPTVIASTIAAANAGYTTASKAQLSAWTTTLTNYNEGITGPGHCTS
jgi:hypothetical protein